MKDRKGLATMKVRIVWNGAGGELDSIVVSVKADDDSAVSRALVNMVDGNIVNPGDSFEIEEITS